MDEAFSVRLLRDSSLHERRFGGAARSRHHRDGRRTV